MQEGTMRGVKPAVTAASARTDADLVHGVAGGDLHALGVLFDRFEPDLARLIGRMDVPAADVDDLVQLSFMDVARSASRYDDRWPVRSWICGIALMNVRRHRRSMAQVAARVSRWTRERAFTAPPRPDERAEGHELARLADGALRALTQKKREVFVMVVLEGMSCDEVARSLAIPVATVWTRLHHARRELREILKEHSP
jgi:RNA polymerase sigma-70 factor, ECF subfamily